MAGTEGAGRSRGHRAGGWAVMLMEEGARRGAMRSDVHFRKHTVSDVDCDQRRAGEAHRNPGSMMQN